MSSSAVISLITPESTQSIDICLAGEEMLEPVHEKPKVTDSAHAGYRVAEECLPWSTLGANGHRIKLWEECCIGGQAAFLCLCA